MISIIADNTVATNGLINFTNQLNGVIQNPLDFAFSMMPPSFNQGLYLIQNPQQIINNALGQVPELNNFLGQISSITGFGLNGNMGFGLQSVLQGLQGGVLASILNGFATQFSILSQNHLKRQSAKRYFIWNWKKS